MFEEKVGGDAEVGGIGYAPAPVWSEGEDWSGQVRGRVRRGVMTEQVPKHPP
jgi:hypothetical protein